MTILVVEDNPSDVFLLQEAFRELHSRAVISVARDGYECLETLFGSAHATNPLPDLIFLDLNLPGINGYDVLLRIKSEKSTRHIPVIVLSSEGGGPEIERAYEAHANAYVRKPNTLEDLLSAVRGLQTFWMETARLSPVNAS